VLYSKDEQAYDEVTKANDSCATLPTGEIDAYSMRGWCRLEILAALCPKKTISGAWRRGPINTRYRYHHNPADPGVGPKITASDISDPSRGRFTNEADREAVWPLVVCIAQRYEEYHASGSQAWEETLLMKDRPKWLVDAGKLNVEAVFNSSPSKVSPANLGQETRSAVNVERDNGAAS